MSCKQIETRLMDYMDGNLDAREREAIAIHAQSCAACAERIQGFSSVFSLLDDWKSVEPSAAFNARLEQRLAAEASSRPFLSQWWISLFPSLRMAPLGNPVLAAALLFVVSLAALVIRSTPSQNPIIANQTQQPLVASAATGVDDLALYQAMPVLEDLDVLRDFEVLGELNASNSVK